MKSRETSTDVDPHAMTFSLRTKLIVATFGSVATIALLVTTVGFGSSRMADKLRQAQTVTVALRNHTNADMMHDALRGDAFAALHFAVKSRNRRDEIVAEANGHASEFKKLVAANEALSLPGDVRAPLAALDKPIEAYLSAVNVLVTTAFEDEAKAELLLPDMEKKFSILENEMDNAGTSIEDYAEAQALAAESFSLQANWLSTVALVLGLIIAAFATWVTQFDVLAPLALLTKALQRHSKGDYGATLPVARTDEIGQMARTVAAFGREAADRNRLTRETRILSELNEWLQSAKSETELYQMIAEFLSRFLVDCTGTIYIYANSRDILECAKVWNGEQAVVNMHPDDCWGLRRGRTYTHGQHEIEFHCTHVSPGSSNDYCCIPILAHGETVGLLHLEYAPKQPIDADTRKTEFGEQRRLGLAAVEHISLAIANVKLRDQLRDQSIRDVLTGLYNRRYMLETCRREFQRAARVNQPLAMLSIDVDHFKTFNDNHGHDAGDTVLRSVGEVLSATFRGDDVTCRFGGEEFVVVMPGASAVIAAQRAEEIRSKVEALCVRYADGNLPRITISVGVASYPEAGSMPMEVLKVADEALYAAKARGRNCVELSASCRNAIVSANSALPGAAQNEVIVARLSRRATDDVKAAEFASIA